jgi:hypothetical protein
MLRPGQDRRIDLTRWWRLGCPFVSFTDVEVENATPVHVALNVGQDVFVMAEARSILAKPMQAATARPNNRGYAIDSRRVSAGYVGTDFDTIAASRSR